MVFIAGGTGYVGSRVIPQLVAKGLGVRALVRTGKTAAGAQAVVGSALDAGTFQDTVRGCDTYIHLVGTPHPAPWKGEQFRAIDLVSLKESVKAASAAGVRHFVYVSVAHPAPVMKAYIEVRRECEAAILDAGLTATLLRPWYVLGPGHWWPVALKPIYR